MILVTGSRGIIGSAAVTYFQNKEYDVVGIDEDIRDIGVLEPYFKNAEFVIHTAGKVKKGIPHPEDYYLINVLGTKNVCDLSLKYGCKLIHLSSNAVSAPNDDFTIKKYVESKEESQKLVENYLKKGLKGIILKLCVIYTKENNTGRRGARYPVERLVADFENLIKSHSFTNYQIIDYSNVRA